MASWNSDINTRVLLVRQRMFDNNNVAMAKSIGVHANDLSQMCVGARSISLRTVMGIAKVCPNVNLRWLLFGEESMYSHANEMNDINQRLATLLEQKDKQMATLLESIEEKREENKQLTLTNFKLRQRIDELVEKKIVLKVTDPATKKKRGRPRKTPPKI